MKKISFATFILTLLLSMISIDTFAFVVDGIYYNLIKGKAAEVTYMIKGNNNKDAYSGNVVIPEKVTYEGVEYPVDGIGENAFYKCSGLTSITIPNSVTSIGNEAFSSCSGLTSISIPNSVTYIGNEAFSSCYGLTSITIPNSVTYIGQAAFYYCSGLTSVTIGNGVTSIGNLVFGFCSNLKSITVESENEIYDSRDNCNAIIETNSNKLVAGCKNTIIPSGVKTIANSAFNGCSSLTFITIPNSVTSIERYAFFYCEALTSITIPNCVTSIGDYAFSSCRSLTSITIPNSVTSIGDYAFYDCLSFTSITIGNSVTYIGQGAFANCGKLEEVYCYAENVPSTETDAFKDSYPKYATLYVSASSINNYKTKTPWSQFGTIKEIPGSSSVQAVKESVPVLISASNGLITVKGELDGEPVAVYTAEGKLMGSGTMNGGQATVSTSLGTGAVAVVKVGRKAVKVVMK